MSELKEDYLYYYNAKLVRIVDGDTLICQLDLGFSLWKKVRLRLARINCLEIRGENKRAGKAATAFVKDVLPNTFIVKSTKLDNWGRAIAEVYFDELNLSDYIVKNGHGEYRNYK